MKKGELLFIWLSAKGAIFGLLLLILACDYMIFGQKENFGKGFWYEPFQMSSEIMRSKIKRAGKVGTIDRVDDEGETALIIASAAGELEIARMLVENGADVNFRAKNKTGDTALHTACRNGKLEIFNFLLANNANPVTYNKVKVAPIHRMVECQDNNKFKKMVQTYVDMGVSINFPDGRNWPILFWVVDQLNEAKLNILQKKLSPLIRF